MTEAQLRQKVDLHRVLKDEFGVGSVAASRLIHDQTIHEIRAAHASGVFIDRDIADHGVGDNGQIPSSQRVRQ